MNQYLKALNNQRPLCFFDSCWECILEKQGLISKEPRETTGTTETLHPQNTSKNSKAFSKGCLSDTCHFGGQWKAGRAALLCRSKGDALRPLRKEAFLSRGDLCVQERFPWPNVTGMDSRLESGHRTTTTALQLPQRHTFGLHKSSVTFFYCHYTK